MKIGDLILSVIAHQDEHGPFIVDDATFDQGSDTVIQSLSHHFFPCAFCLLLECVSWVKRRETLQCCIVYFNRSSVMGT